MWNRTANESTQDRIHSTDQLLPWSTDQVMLFGGIWGKFHLRSLKMLVSGVHYVDICKLSVSFKKNSLNRSTIVIYFLASRGQILPIKYRWHSNQENTESIIRCMGKLHPAGHQVPATIPA
jgi:hypothetical protein